VNYHDACRVAFLKRMRDPMVVLPPQEEPGRCHDRAVSLLRQTSTVGKRGGGMKKSFSSLSLTGLVKGLQPFQYS
jgi:hypothetical protein